ncbi:MAG: helix-turn-helix transcriptional regulator [Spirochaetales bacterium]|nr:helix-turn-helix transcriptional regulator [Spirochaetales bacterium]
MQENQLELFLRNLKEPTDYYQGISSDFLYFPENIVFFSRLKISDLCNNLPIMHYRFNLVFCLKGSLQIHIDNYLLNIYEGESFLIFPFQNHYYVSAEASDIICFFIGFDMQERKNLEALRNNPVKINSFVLSCLEQIISLSDTFKVNLVSTIILSNIENCTVGNPIAFSSTRTNGNSIVARVQKYVYSDLGKAVTTTIVAKELGISESNLHKQFKKAIGISPGKYLREVKINYACSILEARKLSVTETAAHCGFDSVYSFSRTFKKVTGFSPSQFRKRRKREDY